MGERKGKRERKRETEDRLHIKWTGNEPGYIELVGKSVCRGASFCKVCPPFYLVFRLHRVHVHAHARKRGCIVYGERRGWYSRVCVYPHTHIYIYLYVHIKYIYIYIYTYRTGWERVEGRSLVKSAQDARNGQPFSTFAIA